MSMDGCVVNAALRQRRSTAREDPAQAADALTQQLKQGYEAEFTMLVPGPTPMNVTLEAEPGTDDSNGLRGATFSELGSLYLKIDAKRMVILGAGGSGKSVMLLKLALDLLKARENDPLVPVPVRLSLPNWDVLRQQFDDWVIAELDALKFSPARTRLLLDEGLLLPLLDGLDEMDLPTGTTERVGPRSKAALVELRRNVRPLVLTCRSAMYEEITADKGQLQAGFTGRIADLTAGEIASRLAGKRDMPADWWNPVLFQLSRPGSAVLTELATPWRLSIVMELYGDPKSPERSPQALIDDIREPERLVGRYAEKLLANTQRSRRVGRTLHTIGRYLTAQQDANQETLPEIAGRSLSGTDFVIHQLWPISGHRRPRIVSVLLSVAFWLPSLFATVWVLANSDFGTALRVTTFLLVLALAAVSAYSGSVAWTHPRRIELSRFRTRRGWNRLGAAAGTAVGLGLEASFLGRPWFGLGVAIGFMVSYGMGSCLAVRDTLALRGLIPISTGIGVVLTLAAWALVGERGIQIGIVAGLAVGGFTLVTSVPIALRETGALPGYVANPVFREFVRDDSVVGLFSGLLSAAAVYLLLTSRYGFNLGWADSAWAALAVLVSIGFGTVAETSRRHLAMWLCRPRRLALLLEPTLKRAYDAGLLRRSGIAYQFRHIELRDYFAGGRAELNGGRPPGRAS
ncbi:hypothetical protein AB0J84_26265 [Micromonospora arborensis]|uniref:hypothetical protein n=1 Tax=Micromonospora arborensis TaxID=2116518 RepID=UPI0034346EE6